MIEAARSLFTGYFSSTSKSQPARSAAMIFKLPRIFMSEQRKYTENPQAAQPEPAKIMSPAVLDGPFPGRPKKRISA